jgi:hypothetical protein
MTNSLDQLDFFKKQPYKTIKDECVDLSKIKFVSPDLGIGKSGRTWDYSDIPEGKYFIFKTGGFNRFRKEMGSVFPRLINKITGTEYAVCLETGSDAGYLNWSFKIKSGKSLKIKCHRLVAEAFLENEDPQYYSIVDHKNHDMKDYRVKNLNWVTLSQNASNRVTQGTHIKNLLKQF